MSRRSLPPPPAASCQWAYFLDVDGTLIDFAEVPDAVRIDGRLLALLRGLHQLSGGALALVSGRPLANLDALLGEFRPPSAGQHGLERRDAQGLHWISPVSAEALHLGRTLRPLLDRHPGLLLEDKGLSVALHYRRVPRLAGFAHRLMRRLADASQGLFEVQSGKRVVELRPRGADKGSAVAAFMQSAPFAGRRPVFLGDDRTDEDGFAAVNRLGGISVKIGPGRTQAHHRLASITEARLYLATALRPHTDNGG